MKKFTVDSKKLFTMLSIAKKLITSRMVVPILENFLFEVKDSKLTVSATDLATRIGLSMDLQHKPDDLVALVPVSVLKYLKTVTGPVTISCETEETFSVEIVDEDGKAKYTGDSALDYPKVREFPDLAFTYDTELFREFGDLLGYVSEDELRPAMCSIVLMLHKGQAHLCATDGHRLMTVRVPGLDNPDINEDGIMMINRVPAKILSEFNFKSQMNQVKMHYSKGRTAWRLSFMWGGYEVAVDGHNVDERYPNYFGVIPDASQTKYTIERNKFMKLLDKAELMANKTTHAVTLSLNGTNTISSEDTDFNSEFSGNLGGTLEGTPITICFNSQLLRPTIESFDGDVQIEMAQPNKPAVIKRGSKLALIMPIRNTKTD